MSNVRPFLLFFLFILLSPLGWAQYPLDRSNDPIIDKMTENHIGKTLTLSTLDEVVRTIAQDGIFQVVYVEEKKNGHVVIRASQSKKINNIIFQGNNILQNNELLQAMQIRRGQTLSQLEITQSIDRLKTFYKESGFYNFKIRYQKTQTSSGIDLNIFIDERENCIIDDLQIFTKNQQLKDIFSELVLKFKNQDYKKKINTSITKEINDLLLKNRFLTARIQDSSQVFNKDKTRVKIKYTISNAIQYEFVFHGNHYFSHFDLIKKSEIGEKFLYLNDSSAEITEMIRGLYEKNGFPNIDIQVRSDFFAEANKRVFVFKISEGQRIRIGKVQIVGKISRKKSYYVSLFNEYLAQEAHSVYFVKKDIEHAASEMVTHLKREGHLQAELLSVNALIQDTGTAQITIQIDEGILTYVRQILFRGSKSFTNIQLKDVVEILPNKPLQIGQIESSFDKLERFYQNKAYLEFKIMNRNASVIQYKEGQPYADIVYQVKEGPKIKVKDIRVTGNTKTKSYVILRELDFNIGDELTRDRVANSTTRLERSGLFGKVNIRSLEQGSPNSDRIIVVDVEERRPGLFSAGVGLLSEGFLTYRGYLGALYNNLGGKARGFSSRVDIKYRERIYYLENRVALSYYEPFLFKNLVRGKFSLIREQQLFDPNTRTILSTNDFRFSTEKEYSKHFRFTYNVWGLSNQETFQFRNVPEDDNDDDEGSNKILNIGTTGPVFELDYRNNPFLPTEGSYSRLELEYSDPILGSSRDNPANTGVDSNGKRLDENNEIQYFKTNFSTSHYTPLSKDRRWTWANSLQGGYLSNLSSRDDSGVPQVRSFFLGGASTIRGFSFGTTETVPGKRELCIKQGLITTEDSTSDCRFEEFFVRKDSTYVLFKSELRFPISGNFGGLVFYDGGAVFLGEFNLEDPYRDSIGLGVRYDTPVGSFIFEFGYKLDRKTNAQNPLFDDESEVAIHLAIGTF